MPQKDSTVTAYARRAPIRNFQRAGHHPERTIGTSSALSRGLALLSAFADSNSTWLSNGEMAERTGLPGPTVARLAKSLVEVGMLYYDASKHRFRLSATVLGLRSREMIARAVEAVRPYLQQLADKHHVHVSLAVVDGTDALHLAVCHSASTLMTLRLDVGSRIPIVGTATGHALLAGLDPEQRNEVLKKAKVRHSKNWRELLAGIEKSLDEIERTGFTQSVGSWHTDINGVAVPVKLGRGGLSYAIACGAPSRHLPLEKLKQIGRELVLTKSLREKVAEENRLS